MQRTTPLSFSALSLEMDIDTCFFALYRSGVRGTVILFAAGDAEAGVVFDGQNFETCERVLVRDLEAAGVGFRADPDTPAQPVVAQLLSLLGALLHSDDVSQARRIAGSEGMTCDDGALVWLRVLSQSLMAVLHLSMHCSDTVVAACQDGDVVAHILPQLLEVALVPIQLPALITAQVRCVCVCVFVTRLSRSIDLAWFRVSRFEQCDVARTARNTLDGVLLVAPKDVPPDLPHPPLSCADLTYRHDLRLRACVLLQQDFQIRWRSAQARILSALRLGDGGLRTLRPIQRHPLPPHDAPTMNEDSQEKSAAPKARIVSRDGLPSEESREEALALLRQRRRGHGHAEYSDPILEVARSARTSGRDRLIALGDPHRSWGRGWGSGMSGSRRVAGVRGALDWVGRGSRDEDDARREGSRRRLARSDLSQRIAAAARGRRAASAESRVDPRRPAARVFHEYDRSEGFAEYSRDDDDESGALLVEFNDADGADGEPEGRETAGTEGGSAGSADSGDTSQDGDEMVRLGLRMR